MAPSHRATRNSLTPYAYPTARGALIGWLAGLAMTIWVCFGTNISFLWYAMTGCLTTMGIGFVVSLFEPAPDRKSQAGLVWANRTPPPVTAAISDS